MLCEGNTMTSSPSAVLVVLCTVRELNTNSVHPTGFSSLSSSQLLEEESYFHWTRDAKLWFVHKRWLLCHFQEWIDIGSSLCASHGRKMKSLQLMSVLIAERDFPALWQLCWQMKLISNENSPVKEYFEGLFKHFANRNSLWVDFVNLDGMFTSRGDVRLCEISSLSALNTFENGLQ